MKSIIILVVVIIILSTIWRMLPDHEEEEEVMLEKIKQTKSEVSMLNKQEKKVYTLACPFRSLYLTGVMLGEFSTEHYPWLVQYNQIPDDKVEELRELLIRDFNISDETSLYEEIKQFIETWHDSNRCFVNSTVLYLLTSAADLHYISYEALMEESKQFMMNIHSVEEYLSGFMEGMEQSGLNGRLGKGILSKHVRHLANDELSPFHLNYA